MFTRRYSATSRSSVGPDGSGGSRAGKERPVARTLSPEEWARQQAYKDTFFVLMVLSISVYGALLIWGLRTTKRQGTPSISRMLADDVELTLFFVVGVALYGEARSIIDASTAGDGRHWGLRLAITIFGVAQIVCFLFVAFITVDDDKVGHYTVAAMSGVFSVLREVLSFYARCTGDEGVGEYQIFWLGFNVTLLVLLLVMMIMYAVTELGTPIGDPAQSSVFEYMTFGVVVMLPVLHLLYFKRLDQPSGSQGSNRLSRDDVTGSSR